VGERVEGRALAAAQEVLGDLPAVVRVGQDRLPQRDVEGGALRDATTAGRSAQDLLRRGEARPSTRSAKSWAR